MPPPPEEKNTRERIRQIRQRATDLGLKDDEIKAIFTLDSSQDNQRFIRILKAKLLLRKLLTCLTHCKSFLTWKLVIAVLVVAAAYFYSSSSPGWDLKTMIVDSLEERCILSLPPYLSEVVRPRVPCAICKDLVEVPVVYDINQTDFTEKYAYTGIPVLIKGAIPSWRALDNFSYDYFKKLYTETKGSLEIVDVDCQFFGYQTEFDTLEAVFEMSDDRAALKNGTIPWYIGWSNCDSNTNEVGKQLRTQYSRPYFLPSHSSNMDTDWIFMGGPGFGAGMHIDHVERPSWQAQISGSKTWMLDPSPECWNECSRLEVTVEKGDIIVLDTNIWYHSTRVNPGNISITIGAEYD